MNTRLLGINRQYRALVAFQRGNIVAGLSLWLHAQLLLMGKNPHEKTDVNVLRELAMEWSRAMIESQRGLT